MEEVSQLDGILNGGKYVFKILQLPNIKGLLPLSKNEIKKDIRDIERLMDDDSESESSIKSKDISNSNYPVKPRKTLKPPIRMDRSMVNDDYLNGDDDDDDPIDVEDLSTEDVIEFMKIIETCRRGVFEAERDKERLEIKYQAIRDSFIASVSRFTTDKRDQENYLRTTQSIFIRLLRVHMYYNKQNRMIYNVLGALKYQRESVANLRKEVDRLKLLKESKSCSIDPRPHVDGSYMLRVTLNSKQPNERQIVFFLGQKLETPYGIGTITAIFPQTKNLHLQLPYGAMYMNVMNAVTWGNVDISSDESICRNWAKLDKYLRMPHSVQNEIQSLLKGMDELEGFPDENGESIDADHDIEDSDDDDEADDDKRSARANLPKIRNSKNLSLLKTVPSSELSGTLDSLPMVFAPPSSIPYLVEEKIHSADNKLSLQFCRSSLLDCGQMQAVGPGLNGDADINHIIEELNRVKSEIQNLEATQNSCIKLVEKSRIESARLLQHSTSIRLSMFTRRVRHRHAYGHVVHLPVTASVAAPVPAVDIPIISEELAASTKKETIEKTDEDENSQRSADIPTQKKSSRVNGGKDEQSQNSDSSKSSGIPVAPKDEVSKKRTRDEKPPAIIDESDKKKETQEAAVNKKPKRSGTKY